MDNGKRGKQERQQVWKNFSRPISTDTKTTAICLDRTKRQDYHRICALVRSAPISSGMPPTSKATTKQTRPARFGEKNWCGESFPIICFKSGRIWRPKTSTPSLTNFRGLMMKNVYWPGKRGKPAIRLSMRECGSFGRRGGCTTGCA